MNFEWVAEKADANLKKHGVSFDEAKTAFHDPMYLVFADPDHSVDENRYLLVGVSTSDRLLFISYTERAKATRISCPKGNSPRAQKI